MVLWREVWLCLAFAVAAGRFGFFWRPCLYRPSCPWDFLSGLPQTVCVLQLFEPRLTLVGPGALGCGGQVPEGVRVPSPADATATGARQWGGGAPFPLRFPEAVTFGDCLRPLASTGRLSRGPGGGRALPQRGESSGTSSPWSGCPRGGESSGSSGEGSARLPPEAEGVFRHLRLRGEDPPAARRQSPRKGGGGRRALPRSRSVSRLRAACGPAPAPGEKVPAGRPRAPRPRFPRGAESRFSACAALYCGKEGDGGP